jgi:hypothetical protein
MRSRVFTIRLYSLCRKGIDYIVCMLRFILNFFLKYDFIAHYINMNNTKYNYPVCD